MHVKCLEVVLQHECLTLPDAMLSCDLFPSFRMEGRASGWRDSAEAAEVVKEKVISDHPEASF